jgi:hypothetical protein
MRQPENPVPSQQFRAQKAKTNEECRRFNCGAARLSKERCVSFAKEKKKSLRQDSAIANGQWLAQRTAKKTDSERKREDFYYYYYYYY